MGQFNPHDALFESIAHPVPPTIKEAVMTTAERLEARGEARGFAKGIEQGIEQGIEKGIEKASRRGAGRCCCAS